MDPTGKDRSHQGCVSNRVDCTTGSVCVRSSLCVVRGFGRGYRFVAAYLCSRAALLRPLLRLRVHTCERATCLSLLALVQQGLCAGCCCGGRWRGAVGVAVAGITPLWVAALCGGVGVGASWFCRGP
jgi:hypothetical protein